MSDESELTAREWDETGGATWTDTFDRTGANTLGPWTFRPPTLFDVKALPRMPFDYIPKFAIRVGGNWEAQSHSDIRIFGRMEPPIPADPMERTGAIIQHDSLCVVCRKPPVVGQVIDVTLEPKMSGTFRHRECAQQQEENDG